MQSHTGGEHIHLQTGIASRTSQSAPSLPAQERRDDEATPAQHRVQSLQKREWPTSPAEALLDLETESGAIHTPHKPKGQGVQMTTPSGKDKEQTPPPPSKVASGRKTPRKLARLQRKATFRRRRRSSAAAAPRAAATPELWRDRQAWGKLSKEEKLSHLPRAVSRHAEGKASAHSFTIRRGQAAVECLLRERAFWCRAHQDGKWAENAQRHVAWIKSGGPEAAFRLALAAAGAT